MKQRKIVVIGGGTMVHVTPHFSLCAPAYGKVAKSIHDKLCAKGGDVESVLVLTKMAQTKPQLSPLIETNDDLSQYVDTLLEDDSVKCIVMSAAVCDFEPEKLAQSNGVLLYDFDKSQERLSSSYKVNLNLKPSEKIVSKIKQKRPDIFLVTFKTTSDVSDEKIISSATLSREKNQSDIVFANDIKRKKNFLVTFDKVIPAPREEATNILVNSLINI
jgi:phosphopantothenoylcysteine decarboxylase/phosphopantothenate--cysteine ligase